MKGVLALGWLLLLPCAAVAQSSTDAARLLARADSAFTRRDSAAARSGYDAVLRIEPDHSRALYQRARLHAAGSAEAVRLLRRYVMLEPQDAWGFLALGEALEAAGELDEARIAYQQALKLEPRDAEMRAALARVTNQEAAPSNGRLTIEPLGQLSGDSDGNRTLRTGVSTAFGIADSLSFGGAVSHLEVSDDFTRHTAWEATLSSEWRPRRALLMQLRGGLVQIGADETVDETSEGVWHGRLRWRPVHGPAIDVRARREPISSTPQLFSSTVVLTEGRATLELPLVSFLAVRGMTRVGRLRDPVDVNERTGWGAGPVLRLGSTQLSGSYARTTYARPSSAGYFAPRRIDAVDAGVYLEHYGWWPFSLALDVGGGVERVTLHERATPQRAVTGSWERALRGWTQLSWAFAQRSELRLEAEAYETKAGDVVAVTPAGWRWGSMSVTLSWRP